LSQFECATFATLVDILRAGEAGTDRPRVGNRHAWKAPQGVYPAEGADAWVAVAVETDEQWLRLCEAINRPDLAKDVQLRTHRGRYAQHGSIDDAIRAWTSQRTKHEAMLALQQAGVPAGAVLHSKDLHNDPQVRALEYFRAAWGQELGLRIFPGTWYGMQTTPGDVRRGTSNFGEDNERILRDLLGYDDGKINELLRSTDAFSDIAEGLQQPATLGLPVSTLLARAMILSWDDDYRDLPQEVAERNQLWRREHGLPEIRLDGREE
jgi:crotonobetainyl-CoA:carnitine CoA-transferase CaiB-like acyl-CoA transferase